MARYKCPNDGMVIPLVSEVHIEAERVRFFWCWSCMELFASVGDPGTDAASFAEGETGGWQLFRSRGTEHEVATAKAAVSHVLPPSAFATKPV
jgi:hypothetical protein